MTPPPAPLAEPEGAAAAEVAAAAPPPPGAAEAPLDIWGAEILAPMVRASLLPLRLECLRYGADLVFGEEVIDKKFIGAVRIENPEFGTVDYVSPRERLAVFSTRPEERNRVIFQLGTADPTLAVEAATTVCRDVRGIDVNMGCPKSFSVKGGMGAALLEKPEAASEILKSLRRSLPSSVSVTCKIRMLATTEKTRDFMRCCEASGAEAITVHLRRRAERPAEPAHWDEIIRLWDAVRVPVVANGDFFTRRQIDEFWKHSAAKLGAESMEEYAKQRRGPAGIMVARGALWNPSIFCRGGREPPSFEEVVRSYTEAAVRSNSTYQNTKWVLNHFNTGGAGVTPPAHVGGVPMKTFAKSINIARSMAEVCGLAGAPFSADEWPAQAHTPVYYRQGAGAVRLQEAANIETAPAPLSGASGAIAGVGKRAAACGVAAQGEGEVNRAVVDGESSNAKRAKVSA